MSVRDIANASAGNPDNECADGPANRQSFGQQRQNYCVAVLLRSENHLQGVEKILKLLNLGENFLCCGSGSVCRWLSVLKKTAPKAVSVVKIVVTQRISARKRLT